MNEQQASSSRSNKGLFFSLPAFLLVKGELTSYDIHWVGGVLAEAQNSDKHHRAMPTAPAAF